MFTKGGRAEGRVAAGGFEQARRGHIRMLQSSGGDLTFGDACGAGQVAHRDRAHLADADCNLDSNLVDGLCIHDDLRSVQPLQEPTE